MAEPIAPEGVWIDPYTGAWHHIKCWWVEETVITELLKKAGAGEDSRADLKRQLDDARFFYEIIPTTQIPAKTYEKIATATRKLLTALTDLDRQLYAASNHETLLVWIDPSLLDHLRDVRRKADNSAKVAARRGQPEKLNKLEVVKIAADFFSRHSSVKASTNENNPFRHFAEQFFSAATRVKIAEGNLDWQIRSVLKAKGQQPRLITKKSD